MLIIIIGGYFQGSGYGYGTVPGGRWTIDTEGGHVVDSVSLIRSGYEYGTVSDRRGTIHTESGRERGKFRIPNAIAMSHAVNCPNYIFMVEHPIPALLVFITIWLHFFY